WVYEVTPEGIRKESEIDRSDSITTQTGHKLNIALIVAIALGIGTLLADRILFERTEAPAASAASTPSATSVPLEDSGPGGEAEDPEGDINAIAVLPFEDFSQAKDQGHLATGIADTILHALAQVEGLKVAARTSSFRLAEQKADIATVGDRLKVGAVLEGSVQKAGDQLRIIAQLIRVSDESHLWSETFDRSAGDIFAIQDEIAAAVIGAIGSDATATSTEIRRTSPEVYEQFLRARELWEQRTLSSSEEAVRLLREVVKADPDFAPGHSELAQAILVNATNAGNRNAVRDLVRREARRALELDPEDAAAYRVLGNVAQLDDDQDQAIEMFRKSLELNPNDPTTHADLSVVLIDGALWDQAGTHLRAAVELDPLDLYARGRLADYLVVFGNDPDRAVAVVEETIALAPGDAQTWDAAADVYLRLGRNADAVVAAFRRVELDPESPATLAALAEMLARIGDVPAAERWIALAATMDPSAEPPCNWYADDDLQRALSCILAEAPDDASEAERYEYAEALWVSGRDAEALAAFDALLERSTTDRAQGFVRYSDLVALVARLVIRPVLDLPVTDADRLAPRRLRDQITGQTVEIDRWSEAHILAAEGRLNEAAQLLDGYRYSNYHARRMAALPLFAELREHPVIVEGLAAYRSNLEAEYERLVAEGDPVILAPPATVDDLIARLENR
ncbi:MAG: tetratricopeptide repeat protein, partial [Pseudomonadota bacterium]